MQLRKGTLLDSFKFTPSPVTNINLLLILSKHNQQKKSSMSVTDHQVEQGWHSGESTRLPPMWPGVDAICGLSLLLVFSLAPRGFSPGTLVFPSPQKPTFPNSNSTRNQVDEEPLCGCATCKSLFIYLFIY